MHNLQSPRTDDTGIEQEIQAKGLTAPRVTPVAIEGVIASEHYFTAKDGRSGAMNSGSYVAFEKPEPDAQDLLPLGLLTFCVLVLKNGFTVTGESACASPENFDADVGRKVARQNAIQKIWPLLGYTLKERLFQEAKRSAVVAEGNARHYRGTKEVLARPMTRGDYNAYRGWTLPADEVGSDRGYLVEYLDGGKANDSRHAGYISWSPADVFERTYVLL